MDKHDIAFLLFRAYKQHLESAERFRTLHSSMAEYQYAVCDGIRFSALELGVVDIFDDAVALYEELRG